MSENAEVSTEVKAEPKLTFADFLAKTGLPEAALTPITSKVNEHNALVSQSNTWVSQVNAARAQDPSKPGYVDYLDDLWKGEQAKDNPLVSEKAAEFDAIAEQYEKLLSELRETAKSNFIPEELSEEKAKETRAKVNAADPVIKELRKAIAAQLLIPESMLEMAKVSIPEGGLVSLLPNADSLKSPRGRKAAMAAGGNGVSYMTRVGDVLIDGQSTRTEKGGKFDYAAEVLSEKFGRSIDPGNEVTAESLEEAYFEELKVPYRSIKGKDIPDSRTFTFTKVTKRPNPNDGEMVEAPVSVKITVVSQKAWDAQNATEDKPETETPKVETETKTETVEQTETVPAQESKPVSTPAKKATAKPAPQK